MSWADLIDRPRALPGLPGEKSFVTVQHHVKRELAGTPEPGGLSWRELTTLLRRTFERRRVYACDVVELCPIPGMVSPNFVAARLVYKLLAYKFGLSSSRSK